MADKKKAPSETAPTAEQLKKIIEESRIQASAMKKKVDVFISKHKLRIGHDYSDDPKLGKDWKALKKEQREAIKSRDGAIEKLKAITPKKERVTSYVYPAGYTPLEKKRFRAATRAAKKKESKGDTATVTEKPNVEAPTTTKKKTAIIETSAPVKKKSSAVEVVTPVPVKKKKKED